MTDQHPITPPSELLQLWWEQHNDYQKGLNEILIEATQWGADKQLAEDAKWLDYNALNESHLRITPVGESLKEAMRPKRLSIKEQSLALIDRIQGNKDWWELKDLDIVRKALEQLND